jgi:hypothetical protein
MAKQTQVRYVDDLDGSDAAGPIEFGIDGKSYEIDLSEENANRLREGLSPFIDKSRRPERTRGRSAAPSRSTTSTTSGYDRDKVTQWAQEHGIEVKARGRISKSVLNAYHAEVG